MFFVLAEIEIRMSELLQNFLSLFNFQVRVNVAQEKAEEVSRSFECRFLSQVFGTRFSQSGACSKVEEERVTFQTAHRAKVFLDTDCPERLAL